MKNYNPFRGTSIFRRSLSKNFKTGSNFGKSTVLLNDIRDSKWVLWNNRNSVWMKMFEIGATENENNQLL